MRQRTLTSLVFLVLFSFGVCYGQEIPSGVRYKKAPDAINNLAKSNLEKALASESAPTDFFGEVTVVGPMLWKSLKPTADEVMLATLPVALIIPGPQSVSAEGKRVRTENERISFWKIFRSKYPEIKNAKVRKGNAQEISYYWATIPFDIEEPFWVIESGADRFVAHFRVVGEKPGLFWIDRVDDLRTLKP
jgi:hypothetical protein